MRGSPSPLQGPHAWEPDPRPFDLHHQGNGSYFQKSEGTSRMRGASTPESPPTPEYFQRSPSYPPGFDAGHRNQLGYENSHSEMHFQESLEITSDRPFLPRKRASPDGCKVSVDQIPRGHHQGTRGELCDSSQSLPKGVRGRDCEAPDGGLTEMPPSKMRKKRKFSAPSSKNAQPDGQGLHRLELDSSGDLPYDSDDSGDDILDDILDLDPLSGSPVCGVDILCSIALEGDLSLDQFDSFRFVPNDTRFLVQRASDNDLDIPDGPIFWPRDYSERRKWTLSLMYLVSGNVLSEVDPQRRPWFMVGSMEQIELVIDYKIPKGTSTESPLNLPSSAICLDSIPKIFLTLLRDETIEIMGIIKKLCHIDECSNDTGVVYYERGLSPDNDFELRAKVISILVTGNIIFLIILTMARKRIRNLILFKSNNELDALILQESDFDDSYLADQILYGNLLKEAVLISSKGSSGPVFKVRFLELECAMKVFHSNASIDLRKESITLLNLSHSHVVKFLCIFRKSFIVMELMDEDLYSFITKIRERRIFYDMPLEVALDIMLQIAEGMSYLHHQGIVHQDLKSLNILLKLRGEFDDPDFQIIAKVADLGSARRFDPRYPTGFVLFPNMNIGTRSWRAPELFHRRRSFWTRFIGVNPRVLPKPLDIYGFAVICSELLTRQIPFSNDQDLRVAVLASKLREGHRPALPSSGCPQGLLALIKDCWHGDPVLSPEFHEVCSRLVEVKSSWMSRGQSSES